MGIVRVKSRSIKNNRKNRRFVYIQYMNVLNSQITGVDRSNSEQYSNLKAIARKLLRMSGCNN